MGSSEEGEIVWGRITGKGGRNKKIQFYESFTYDRVEYFKYDNVYLFRDGDPEPFVGKLLKMWETGDKQKKGKVLWFFRPAEVSNFVRGEALLDNEVFLASGGDNNAPGLANINPLEAIAGKCDVVCISKDARNRQPNDEEIRNADFVFRRTFDVESCTIKDDIEEEIIAGTDVKFLLNSVNSEKGCCKLKLKANSGKKKVSETTVQNDLTVEPKDAEAVNTNGHCTDSPANEATTSLNVWLTNPESSTQEKTAACGELDNAEKSKVRKNLVVRVESEGNGKRVKDSDGLDNRPAKKAKTTSENVDTKINGFEQSRFGSDNDTAMEALTPTSVGRKNEIKTSKKEGPSQEFKLDRKTKLAKGKAVKTSLQEGPSEVPQNEEQELAITPKDKSKWFMDRPWEDELRDAHQHGKLVLLQNLDPSFTSAEVKDLILQVFEESCKAKMIQRTAFCNPLSGRAYVIFATRETAEMVIKKLHEGCLLLPNGRVIVASPGTPCFPKKKPTYFGHFAIEKLKYQLTREQKDAVSTSHCSQPNTMEYDMATEWCLLHKRSELQWKKLYEKHEQDLKPLKAQLKSRR